MLQSRNSVIPEELQKLAPDLAVRKDGGELVVVGLEDALNGELSRSAGLGHLDSAARFEGLNGATVRKLILLALLRERNRIIDSIIR